MFNLLAGIAFVGAASYLSGGCGPFRVHHAMRAGEKLRVNWSREKFTPRDLAIGMNVEREHRNITGCSPTMSAKIALAHLREKPNYYVLLRRHVDGLGAKPWDAARHRSQRFSPSRKFKGSEFDSWTDEELMEKVINLLKTMTMLHGTRWIVPTRTPRGLSSRLQSATSLARTWRTRLGRSAPCEGSTTRVESIALQLSARWSTSHSSSSGSTRS